MTMSSENEENDGELKKREKFVIDFIQGCFNSNEKPYKHKDAILPEEDWEIRLHNPGAWISNFDIDNFLGPFLSSRNKVSVMYCQWLSRLIRKFDDKNLEDESMQKRLGKSFMLDYDTSLSNDYRWIIPNLNGRHFNLIIVEFKRSRTLILSMDSLRKGTENTMHQMKTLAKIFKLLSPEIEVKALDYWSKERQNAGQCGLFICTYAILISIGVSPDWILENVTPGCAEWIRCVMFNYYKKVEKEKGGGLSINL